MYSSDDEEWNIIDPFWWVRHVRANVKKNKWLRKQKYLNTF